MSPFHLKHAAFALLLVSYPMVTVAQTDPKVEAGQHFDRGLALAKQKAYVEAINEFNRAYQLSPHFSVMYNLGQAYIAIEQPVFAVEALRRYLDGGKREIPRARRKQVEASITAQERRIATVTLHTELAGAVIRADGLEVGRTPLAAPLRLAAGSHVLDAFLPGYGPWEQKLDLKGKERRGIEIRLTPAAPAPVATTLPAVAPVALTPSPSPTPVTYSAPTPADPNTTLQPAPAAAPPMVTPPPIAAGQPAQAPATDNSSTLVMTTTPTKSRGRKIAAGIIGGVGVGALVVGSVFGLRAFSKKSSSDEQCPNEQCTVEGVSLNDEARTAATVSTITFGVGLASVAAATYLLLVPGRASAPGTMAQRVHVAPQLGPGQAGLAVQGVW